MTLKNHRPKKVKRETALTHNVHAHTHRPDQMHYSATLAGGNNNNREMIIIAIHQVVGCQYVVTFPVTEHHCPLGDKCVGFNVPLDT